MSNPRIDDFSALSNDDVAILYNIVTAAQDSPELPFRALFAAYDKVLAENAIRPENDQTYFRFLLRMGESQTKKETLYDQFEALLATAGIKVDFREEDNSEDSTSHSSEGPQTEAFSNPLPSRRASFDAAFDVRSTGDSLLKERRNASPTRSWSREIERKVQGIRRRNISDDVAELHVGRETAVQPRDQDRVRARENRPPPKTRTRLAAHRARSADSAYQRQQLPLVPMPGTKYGALEDPSDSEVDDGYSGDHSGYHTGSYEAPLALLYQPSESQMLQDAETFYHQRMRSAARALMRNWHVVALLHVKIAQQMRQNAEARDRETLLHQAYDQWRSALSGKGQAKETDKFFEQLEVKASKARDFFLLTKAFTHWAQSASDEILRTSVAKRHILRTRYFSAWRDVAAVNQLKVRRVRVAKFLKIWKGCTQDVLRETEKAYVADESTLIKKSYRTWFWQFCERRAPYWFADKARVAVFDKWLNITQELLDDKFRATQLRHIRLSRKAIFVWRRRIALNVRNYQVAEIFRQMRLKKALLEKLHAEAKLAPQAHQVTRTFELRIVRNTLNILHQRAGEFWQANEINALRIMRICWTTWNDRLRSQTLSRTIDDRISVEVLYKWVMKERRSLCERIFDQQLKRRMISRWSIRLKDLCTSLGEAKTLLRNIKERNTAASTWTTWSNYRLKCDQNNLKALRFRHSRLSDQVLFGWQIRTQQVQQLQAWSADARFFVLVTMSITAWRTATEANKRLKRRNGYAAIRRKVKRNMATHLLGKWAAATRRIRSMEIQAERRSHDHILFAYWSFCRQWHERTKIAATNLDQADYVYHHQILRQCLHSLLNYLHTLRDNDARAFDLWGATLDSSAASTLRKLNWQVFQIRRQQETAESLKERNTKKHYRNIIRYWQDKTTCQRASSVIQRDHSERENESSQRFQLRGPEGLGAGPKLVDVDLSIMPGYLRTPSKRTGKGRTSTPRTPSTSQVTPYMRRFQRENFVTGPLSAKADFTSRLRGLETPSGIEESPESGSLSGDES